MQGVYEALLTITYLQSQSLSKFNRTNTQIITYEVSHESICKSKINGENHLKTYGNWLRYQRIASEISSLVNFLFKVIVSISNDTLLIISKQIICKILATCRLLYFGAISRHCAYDSN